MPASPSTVICDPSAIRRVATPVPSTAGMPYSRATIELWLSGPPMSVTTAGRHGEQRGPRRGGDAGDQHVAGPHPAEVGRAAEHPGRCGDPPGAGPDARQHVAGLLVRHRRHHVLEHPVPAALGQQLRRSGPTPAAPLLPCARPPRRCGRSVRPAARRGAARTRPPGGRSPRRRPAAAPAPAASGASAARPARCRPARPHGPGRCPAPSAAAGRTRPAAPGPAEPQHGCGWPAPGGPPRRPGAAFGSVPSPRR